jgi:lysyl-tRNA synthetase class 2
MSPLAKDCADQSGISDRFELFVAGKELMNAYSELTDPFEQERRFKLQMRDRELGDVEAQNLDHDYIDALKCGLPPTVGWGLGIDRLCMLLANTKRIRDVIPFPLTRS